MSRLISASAIPVALACVMASTLPAQEKPSSSPAEKTEASVATAAALLNPLAPTEGYDAKSLRIESHWGSYRVIRGATGPVIGTVGVVRSFDLEKAVASSPVAAAEARVYQANHLPGSIAAITGTLALAAGIIMSTNSSNNASTPILIVAGAGAIGWGAVHLNNAYSALSRSLWWYNRDLKR